MNKFGLVIDKGQPTILIDTITGEILAEGKAINPYLMKYENKYTLEVI